MKRKFILLPITLTAFAPVIGLVGCGNPDKPTPPEPEQEYEPIPIDASLATPVFDIFKDHYYKFTCNSFPIDTQEPTHFLLAPKGMYPAEMINVELIKVEINGVKTVNYEVILDSYWKVMFFPQYKKSFVIYIKSNEEKLNWFGRTY